MNTQSMIRNFAIIAHIDHGKSTLADRLMELTGTVARREMVEQLLDSNPIERERGITIKLAPVRMVYSPNVIARIRQPAETKQSHVKNEITTPSERSRDDKHDRYILNLIDTPGHVDFTYEVSRSLAACEGALLVVDATQGVQAQTLANLHLAREHKLTIIPIINKIDLPNARKEATRAELATLGFREDEILEISAKTGENVERVLDAIVERIPAPQGVPGKPLRALVFSSQYDPHKGVVVFVRVVDGYIGAAEVGVGAVRGSPFTAHPSSNCVAVTSSLHTLRDGARKDSPRRAFALSRLKFLASGAEVTPIEIGYF
ncbi:GTP-binding protein, partial [Candidatus Gottesmanbacteria bacterium]|nr:GTP-binding protein [Candidatus Gottesmanbacteria bacterium]